MEGGRSASKESRRSSKRSSRRSSRRISFVFLIRITVLDEAGEEKICVVLPPRNKVWELHRKLAELLGVPPLRQKILFVRDPTAEKPVPEELSPGLFLQDALADPEGHEVDAATVTLVVDESSTFVLTGSVDRLALLWNATAGEKIREYKGHLNCVNTANFSRDGSLLVTASDDHTARLWSTLSAEHLGTYRGHKWAVNSAVFEREVVNKPEEKKKKKLVLKPPERHICDKILTASQDGTLKIFDMKTEKCLKTFQGHTAPVNCAAWNWDATEILSASHDSTAKLWNVETLQCIRTFKGHKDIVFGAVYSADCSQVLTASCDRSAALWSARTGQCLRKFENHRGSVLAAVFSFDHASVLTVCEDHVTCRIHNIETGECSVPFKGDGAFGQSACLGHDGRSVLLGYANRTAQIWNLEEGERIQTLRGHTGQLVSAVFSPFEVEVEVKEEAVFVEGKVIEALFAGEPPYARGIIMKINDHDDTVTVDWEHKIVPVSDAREALEEDEPEDPEAAEGKAAEGKTKEAGPPPGGFEEGMVIEAKFVSWNEAYHTAGILAVNDDDTLTVSWEYNTVPVSNCRKAYNFGNPVTQRKFVDKETDVQFVDTGNSCPEAGRVTSIKFFVAQAKQANHKFRFYRHVKGNKYNVVGETPVIECPRAPIERVYMLENPIEVQAGDHLGWEQEERGTLCYTPNVGGEVRWKDGIEADWENLDFGRKEVRTYSYEIRYEKLEAADEETAEKTEEDGKAAAAVVSPEAVVLEQFVEDGLPEPDYSLPP